MTDRVALLRAVAADPADFLRVEGGRLTTEGVSILLNSPKLPNLRTIDARGNWELYRSTGALRDRFPGRRILY